MDKFKGTKDIDAEVAALEKLFSNMQTDQRAATERVTKASEVRRAVALQATGYGDAKAQKTLQLARTDQRNFEMECEDLESAIAVANQKLNLLAKERTEAAKKEAWMVCLQLSKEAQGDAKQMDQCLDDFFNLLQAHGTLLDSMTVAAKDAGVNKVFSTKHFLRCFRYRLYKMSPKESSLQNDIYKNSYSEIFESIIENATEHGGAKLELPEEAQATGGTETEATDAT